MQADRLRQPHSALMPALSTTLVTRLISSATERSNSSGLARRLHAQRGELRNHRRLLHDRDRFAAIFSGDRRAGARIDADQRDQVEARNHLGQGGHVGRERRALRAVGCNELDAIAFDGPLERRIGREQHLTWPPSRAGTDWPVPRYGMWVMLRSSADLTASMVRWCVLPMPDEP